MVKEGLGYDHTRIYVVDNDADESFIAGEGAGGSGGGGDGGGGGQTTPTALVVVLPCPLLQEKLCHFKLRPKTQRGTATAKTTRPTLCLL